MNKAQRKKILRILVVVSILVLLAFTFKSIIRLVVLALIIAINFFFSFLKRFLPLKKYFFGIELILFSTVFTSISFGPKIGFVMGGLLMTINYIGEKRFSRYFIITLSLYSLIGYISYFFRTYNIILFGILLSAIYNLVVWITVPFFGANRRTLIIFNITNILFNIFLFTMFGSFIPQLS